MVFSVAFEHKLSDTTSYKAYETIEQWVYSQGGKVKENHRPNLIVATHGKTPTKTKKPIAWRKDARKTLRFELTQQASDVIVKVNVSPTSTDDKALTARAEEARSNWNDLLNSLWKRFGEDVPIETGSTRGGRPVNWERTMRNGKIMIYIGSALTATGLLGIVLFPASGIFLVSTTGTVLLVSGLMNFRAAKKHFSTGKSQK